jgi:N-glycosidase YbiA
MPRRADWDAVKEDVMYEGLKLKFQVHKDLCEKLLETGDRDIVEHTFRDKYWADGGNG